MSAIASRISQGVGLGMMRQLVSIASQAITVPLFLSMWGNQAYGEWLSLTAALAYISMLDGGAQMYAVNLLTGHFVRKEVDEYRQVAWSMLRAMALVGVLALAVVGGLVAVVPLGAVFGLTALSEQVASLVVVLLAAQFCFDLVTRFLTGMLRSQLRQPASAAFGLLYAVAVLAVVVAVLLLAQGPVTLALGQGLVGVGVCAAIYRWLRRGEHARQWMRPTASASLRLGLSFLKPGAFFLLLQLSTGLAAQGTVLVVNAAVGAVAVVAFATQRVLVNVMQQLAGILNTALWSEFTAMDAQGDEARLRTTAQLSLQLIAAVVVTSWVYLFFCVEPLLAHWTGGRVVLQPWTFGLLALDAGILAVTNTATMRLVATNRHRVFSIQVMTGNACAIALGWWAARDYGTAGVAAAMALCDLVFRIPGLVATARLGGHGVWRVTLLPLVRTMLVGLPTVGVGLAVAWAMDGRSWAFLGAQAVGVGLAGAAGLGIALGPQERAQVAGVIAKRARRGRA